MSERDWPEIVRRLRAKAESTQFPEEGAALSARADHLASKYGVNEEPAAAAGPRYWQDMTAEERDWFMREQERVVTEWMARQQAAGAARWGRPVTSTETSGSFADGGFTFTITLG